jgi:hypothetical protein
MKWKGKRKGSIPASTAVITAITLARITAICNVVVAPNGKIAKDTDKDACADVEGTVEPISLEQDMLVAEKRISRSHPLHWVSPQSLLSPKPPHCHRTMRRLSILPNHLCLSTSTPSPFL